MASDYVTQKQLFAHMNIINYKTRPYLSITGMMFRAYASLHRHYK